MASSLASPRGPLLAIGGAEDKTSDLKVLSRVAALAPDDAREVAVVATASSIPDQILPAYEAAFRRLGARAVHLLDVRHRGHAGDPGTAALVARSGVVFFTGGDQLRLAHVLGGSRLLAAVRARHAQGAVVAGTSAGAAALSTTMIYDGDAAAALRKSSVRMCSGLGFLEDVVIDSHVLQRGRFARLMEAGAHNPERLGVGLGEDAGVIVHAHRVLEAVGPGHVIVVDGREIGSSNVAEAATGEPVAVERVVMHALIDGHGFDMADRRFLTPAALRARMGADGHATPPAIPFVLDPLAASATMASARH